MKEDEKVLLKIQVMNSVHTFVVDSYKEANEVIGEWVEGMKSTSPTTWTIKTLGNLKRHPNAIRLDAIVGMWIEPYEKNYLIELQKLHLEQLKKDTSKESWE